VTVGRIGPFAILEEDSLSRTVHLHVGVAKTGTTYLQRVLFTNRALLAEHGVLIPGERPIAHFHASLDLRGAGFGGHKDPDVPGSWSRLVREVDAHRGEAAVISHETLARTDDWIAKRAVDSFDTDDVRVVLTARDLGRQIPAVWQEQVKNRSRQTYRAFLRQVLGPATLHHRHGEFWTPQWLPGVVRRWGDAVGLDRMTIVTVPRRGAAPHLLWRRFAAATGLPDAPYDCGVPSGNPSLGWVEAELLRRLNAEVTGLSWPQYKSLVKHRFAEERLAGVASQLTTVPQRWHKRVEEISESVIEELQSLGVAVVGDLDELRPDFVSAAPDTQPTASEHELLAVAIRVLEGYVTAESPPTPGRIARSVSRARLALRAGSRRLRARVRRG
jgi:hypothetical protein